MTSTLRSGAIHWRLGGSHSASSRATGTRFYWQHDAEFQPGRADLGVRQRLRPAQGEAVARPAARTQHRHPHGDAAQAVHQPRRDAARLQPGQHAGLPGGNWLMGYGGLPDFTEYDSSGHVLLDGTLGKNVQDFRTYLSPWSGQPKSAPAVVASPSGAGALSVSVSWNGATEVASWRVLAGASASSLAPVASGAKSGFQTTITAPDHRPLRPGPGTRRQRQRDRHLGDGQSLILLRAADRAASSGARSRWYRPAGVALGRSQHTFHRGRSPMCAGASAPPVSPHASIARRCSRVPSRSRLCPAAGTPRRETQISFLGVPAGELSRRERHAARAAASHTGRVCSLLPGRRCELRPSQAVRRPGRT